MRGIGGMSQTFRGMSPNIPGNALEKSRVFENNLGHVKHFVERMKGFGWMYIIALDTGDHEFYLFVEEPSPIKSISKQLG